ncbi:hypothetical protein C8J57DRAFT_1212611 [Mycena rebaudengoi]|nr:hypothetical protein C8J57DRAFT_1212611 [Mycena rebaudengoi]
MPGPTKVTGVHWRTSTVTGNQWDMMDMMDKITTATSIQWIYHCVQWIALGSNGAHGEFQWISRQIQYIHTNYHSMVHFLMGAGGEGGQNKEDELAAEFWEMDMSSDPVYLCSGYSGIQ